MKTYLYSLLALLTLSLPSLTYAVDAPSLSVVPPTHVGAGDTVLVPLMLAVPDSGGVNSLQARITVSGPAHITSVSTGGSVFMLWPEGPTVTPSSVSFVGGTPGTVYGSPLRVVTLALTATAPGTVKISVASATAYRGDGAGTPVPLKESTVSIKVGAASASPRNELTTALSHDTNAPDSFLISIGRDASLYDNAYFISFATVDAGSGVRYEVKENDGPWVVANGTYRLIDQSLTGTVVVRASDAAGNARTELLRFEKASPAYGILWIIVVLGVCGAALLIYVLRKRKMRHK